MTFELSKGSVVFQLIYQTDMRVSQVETCFLFAVVGRYGAVLAMAFS